MIKFKITSSIQTKKIAKLLAQEIIKQKLFKNALVIILKGNLGAGKTTFVQGFLRGLGVRKKITSPTFVIQKNYKLRTTTYNKAIHIDCYRIRNAKEISELGFKEIISDPKNIILIEWPERISKILPKQKIQINFKHGKKEHERTIEIES
ncbi:MAG: tRNA (adenosine(37)-N6)-threonylcarbamoyltransferase complex ATPase subunit type 1 TsaE [Patescibacteria group bacterium]